MVRFKLLWKIIDSSSFTLQSYWPCNWLTTHVNAILLTINICLRFVNTPRLSWCAKPLLTHENYINIKIPLQTNSEKLGFNNCSINIQTESRLLKQNLGMLFFDHTLRSSFILLLQSLFFCLILGNKRYLHKPLILLVEMFINA